MKRTRAAKPENTPDALLNVTPHPPGRSDDSDILITLSLSRRTKDPNQEGAVLRAEGAQKSMNTRAGRRLSLSRTKMCIAASGVKAVPSEFKGPPGLVCKSSKNPHGPASKGRPLSTLGRSAFRPVTKGEAARKRGRKHERSRDVPNDLCVWKKP